MKKVFPFGKGGMRFEFRTPPDTLGKKQDAGIVISVSALTATILGIGNIARTDALHRDPVPESGPDHGRSQRLDSERLGPIHKVFES
jgi:hypothetical protein